MIHLLAAVTLIALADSANPSTIAPALYLASKKQAVKRLGGFTLGVFAANFVVGVAVVLGPGRAAVSLLPRPDAATRHQLELAAGGVLLIVSFLLWRARRWVTDHVPSSHEQEGGSPFFLGLVIMAVELPTAFPYFAALALIVGSRASLASEAGLVTVFNLLFVLPLLVILVLRIATRDRGGLLLARIRGGIARQLAVVLPIAVAVAGIALLAVGSDAIS